jgi:hypothetical protein
MNELGKTSMETTASPEDLRAVQDFIIDCLADGQSMTVSQLSQQWCEAHGIKSRITADLLNETTRQALGAIKAEEDGPFGELKETVVQNTNTTVTFYQLSGASEGYQPAVMAPVNPERSIPKLQDVIDKVAKAAINTAAEDATNKATKAAKAKAAKADSPIDPGWAAGARCAGMDINKVNSGICKACPVQYDCLRTAILEGYDLRHRDIRTSGTRGGFPPADQQEMVEKVRKTMHGLARES